MPLQELSFNLDVFLSGASFHNAISKFSAAKLQRLILYKFDEMRPSDLKLIVKLFPLLSDLVLLSWRDDVQAWRNATEEDFVSFIHHSPAFESSDD